MTPRQFRYLLIALTMVIPACRQTAPSESAQRPAMTNAEYERAQLRALGAAIEEPVVGSKPNASALRDNSIRTEPYPVPANRTLPRAQRAVASPAVAAPGRSSSSRTGPVQKAGSIYIGPGGASSRRVGAIMINSDGTTGQMIGNTIYSR